MSKINAENQRVVRDYLIWLKQAHGRTDATVDAAASAIARFQGFTENRPFKKFRVQQAIEFKAMLLEARNERTGEKLSLATVSSILKHASAFFNWLADKPGYKRAIRHSDTAYFNLTERDERIANVSTPRPRPSVEQVAHILQVMPDTTVTERRDRAVVAFALLTGARDGALIGMRLSHVDLERRVAHFDPREVHTKFGKQFHTYFFPVPDAAETIVRQWMDELRTIHLFGPNDPLFPRTRIGLDDVRRFSALGIDRTAWRTASRVRDIFKEACARADLPYFNPHGVRHALVELGYRLCKTPEQMKAWSQNIGHDQALTSMRAYGTVQPQRQAEIILGLGALPVQEDASPFTPEQEQHIRRLLARKA